jgi:hypothetical protein
MTSQARKGRQAYPDEIGPEDVAAQSVQAFLAACDPLYLAVAGVIFWTNFNSMALAMVQANRMP